MHSIVAAHEALSSLPGDVPNPGGGSAPPGVGGKVTAILGWAKWICLGGCVLGLMVAGAMMSVANRRGDGGEHGARVGWALAGAIVVSGAVSLIGFMTT